MNVINDFYDMKNACLILFLSLTLNVFSQTYQPSWESLDKRPLPAWFSKAKFGIFIHWGLYSVPSWATNSYADGFGSNYAEWYWQRLFATNLKIHKEFVDFHERVYGKNFRYPDFASRFTCELFDPEKWASVFSEAGAKYVVLTSKHHEGFCLWPSRESWNWNAMDMGPHRDLAGELSAAVKKEGLHMGFYYSLYEWFNPQYKSNVRAYVEERMLPQMKDLVTRYKPDLLWTDGEWDHPDTVWQSQQFLAWLYNESVSKDSIVVNDRWGSNTKGKHGSFQTSEYGHGNVKAGRYWEECRGIGESFGYNRNENLEQYTSSEELVHQLINVVARGGNFLLNIGPAADGRIPVIMQQRLHDIGSWLKVNGEAIYDTHPWKEALPVTDKTDIYSTENDTAVDAVITRWKDEIVINNIARPEKVSMLGYTGKLRYRYTGNRLTINIPSLTPDKLPCAYAWVIKISKK